MINWFGPKPWDAPICRDTPRCDVPVDDRCARCQRAFVESDRGVTLPGSTGPVAYHFACHLKSVLPHHLWPSAGLTPDDCDGFQVTESEGETILVCPTCRAAYSATNEIWLKV